MEITLYYFSAKWCGPCKGLAPVVEELSKELTSIQFVKVDTDENPEIIQQFGVQSVPTLVMVKDGQEVARIKGALPKPALKSWIKSFE